MNLFSFCCVNRSKDEVLPATITPIPIKPDYPQSKTKPDFNKTMQLVEDNLTEAFAYCDMMQLRKKLLALSDQHGRMPREKMLQAFNQKAMNIQMNQYLKQCIKHEFFTAD
jgi:hypothetical protein